MKCICGSELQSTRITKEETYNNITYTMKNVPCIICPECGEKEFGIDEYISSAFCYMIKNGTTEANHENIIDMITGENEERLNRIRGYLADTIECMKCKQLYDRGLVK